MHFHMPKPLHRWRDFLNEVGIIVLGVTIALGAEALIEHRRIADAVQFSRDDFISELDRNRADVVGNLAETKALNGEVAAVIKEGAAFVQGKSATLQGHKMARSFVSLRSAAWSSALSTQVMEHFPHNEGRIVAQAYTEQQEFSDLQHAEQAVWFSLADQSFIGAPTKQEVATALKHLVVATAYLGAHKESEESLVKTYDLALARLRKD